MQMVVFGTSTSVLFLSPCTVRALAVGLVCWMELYDVQPPPRIDEGTQTL